MRDKVIYYTDELNDDFAGNNIVQKKVPSNFVYVNEGYIHKILSFILYNIIARPIAFLYVKLVFSQRFKNKKVLKKVKNTGYFVYGNHTQGVMDAFLPSIFTFPKKDYIIVNPDAVSIKGIKTLVMMLGGLPTPSTLNSSKNFLEAIKKRIDEKNVVVIYPEAHIWPYYSDVRSFNDTSFKYPYNLEVPSFSFTNVYRKRFFKFIKRPKVVTYIDGPFYVDKNLPKKEAIRKIRDEVYNSMKKRINEKEKYEYIKYIKVEDDYVINQ